MGAIVETKTQGSSLTVSAKVTQVEKINCELVQLVD